MKKGKRKRPTTPTRERRGRGVSILIRLGGGLPYPFTKRPKKKGGRRSVLPTISARFERRGHHFPISALYGRKEPSPHFFTREMKQEVDEKRRETNPPTSPVTDKNKRERKKTLD